MPRSTARGAGSTDRGEPSPAVGRPVTGCGLTVERESGRAWRGPTGICPAGALERSSRGASGFTETERDETIFSPAGVCAICPSAPAEHVDHWSKTGRVRGVLCFNCNSAIGKLGDDPDTVGRAAAYSEGNAWKPTLVAPGVCRLPS
ncbi:endonuclease domain-containing protein [Streptomyces chengmaiensis]|uniref:endonuclease domain-containing protein n=1 Tax=Streptomyces chengmaiensis TaxID=3040919 RepID=UPI0029624B66|nr:endonuclease domain-containing protein [Streptomyces chengmaiensis]